MLLKYFRLKKVVGFVFVVALMVGCGGGGGGGGGGGTTEPPPTQTAYFIDSAVEGVSYSCGTLTGTTDITGKFSYNTSCSEVTLKLGNLSLGAIAPNSINPDGKLTIQDLVGVERTNITHGEVLKIATILQSLDSDGDPSDRIKLENVSSLSGDINNSSLSIDDIVQQFNTANPHNVKTVKSEDDVKAHLETTMIDAVPNSFSFASKDNQERNSNITSTGITISGIQNTTSPVSIENGSFSINGSNTWQTSGTIANNQTIQVKHTSSSLYNTNATTTLTIGGVSGTFTSKTRLADTTPTSFNFTSITDIFTSSEQISNEITVQGIEASTNISISNGSFYSIDGGNWVSSAGTIANGQKVKVKHTSSASFSTLTTTTLTIGGITGSFSSTTLPIDTTPATFDFVSQTGVERSATITSASATITGINAPATITITNGSFSINESNTWQTSGTISNNQSIKVRHTSSASYNTTTQTTLTIGGVSSIFNVTTLQAPTVTTDTTPENFSFDSQTGVERSATITSASATITGINAPATITITNGSFSINGSNTWQTSGTISNNQTIRVQHTSSANFSSTTTTTVTIGGVSKTFNSTTLSIDTTPDLISFSNKTNVELNTSIESNATITGINSPISVSILNGTYKIASGSWTDGNSTISNGEVITIRHTSSTSFDTNTTTTVMIGGVSYSFISTTKGLDITPDDFNFTSHTDVNKSIIVTSNTITIRGVEVDVNISITDGEYTLNNDGNWTNLPQIVSNDDNITLRHTSSGSFDANTTTVVTIGSLTKTFISTTREADTIPDTFSFASKIGVVKSTNVESNVTTIAGIEEAVNVSISNGQYKINSGEWIETNSTISNGETIAVRHTSASSFETNTTTTLTIGGVSSTFTSTTEARDTTPDSFGFNSQAATKNSIITSNTITISGINDSATLSITGGEYKIGDGNWADGNTTISNNATITVRHTTPLTNNTTTTTRLTIGGVTGDFNTTTDSSYFQGYLSDGFPIQGIQVSSSEYNSSTVSDGGFQYAYGTVTFRLNNLILGSILASSINSDQKITLQEIVGNTRNKITSNKLSKIVQLLHSLDVDKDSSNGITIENKYLDGNGTTIELNGTIESFSDEEIANEIIRVGRYPVIKFDAMKNMLENLKSNTISVADFALYPEANATNVGPYTLVKIGFGESMNASTITNNIKLNQGSLLNLICDYNDTLMMATCKIPTNKVAENTVFPIELRSGIQNISNVAIIPYNFSFTTGTKNILPKLQTGQGSVSYDINGSIASSGTIKDDGYYNSTKTARNITKTLDTVTDASTTLKWYDLVGAQDHNKTYEETVQYCADLNISGIDNWRLPSIKEFSLIGNKGAFNPAKFSAFGDLEIGTNIYYATSNYDEDLNASFVFDFTFGADGGSVPDDNDTYYVQCVSGDSVGNGEFVRDDINEIVVDTSSGLMWQDTNTSEAISTKEWLVGINYCEELVFASYDDWRLPNYNELLSLLEMEKYDATKTEKVFFSSAFKNIIADTYWASTSSNINKSEAWLINFSANYSISEVSTKDTPSNVRCVRGN